ncbi:unnamed protein product [Pleuronectes platessa]|uniref:Uncharacterized protein n=1 Tax=Pleuronectes platessa TaxID=8262 RepID=A0A9N7UXN5_PLEPL|nr:unnamed protein product [Pleuronectes platessa]
MPSVENLSLRIPKRKHKTALTEGDSHGTCPAKMGSISDSETVDGPRDRRILQSLSPESPGATNLKCTVERINYRCHCRADECRHTWTSADKQEPGHLLAAPVLRAARPHPAEK